MVKRLLSAGHTVTGYNRTKAKADPLIALGMKWADSPRAVAEAADIVFSIVLDADSVRAVLQGPAGIMAGLDPNKVYIDMSTISPADSREFAAQVARETGAKMLEAPVSGNHISIEQGSLRIYIGGDEGAFEKALPILRDISPLVTYVGENGLALIIKLALNLNLVVQVLAFSEGVLLAEKSGIPRAKAVDILVNSAIASPRIAMRGPLILNQPETPWADCSKIQKDMNLAIELGQQLHVPLPATALVNEFLTAAHGMGLGHYDFTILFDVLARLAGVETDH
jgi:3-hydroxyisobutyrate dehydrogenase-like beta-hydroxyacid dehydrogenase